MLSHVCMMTIVVTPFSGTFVCLFDVATPKEDAMSDQCADLDDFSSSDRYILGLGTHCSVRHEQCVCKCGAEFRDTISSQSFLIEHPTTEDFSDRVS